MNLTPFKIILALIPNITQPDTALIKPLLISPKKLLPFFKKNKSYHFQEIEEAPKNNIRKRRKRKSNTENISNDSFAHH